MADKQPKTNNVKNRMLFLSPTVKACLEPEASISDFIKDSVKPIGRGGFGEVYKVRHRVTNRVYVIKVIKKSQIVSSNMVDQLNREVDIMYRINHPHIIKIINHFEDESKFYLVLECAENGQLYNLVRKFKRLNSQMAARYVKETLLAVNYLHTAFDSAIIHRDIKPENILLDEDFRVKLADFGWANFESDDRETYCGTAEYLAPEMVSKRGHDKSVDIWSIGVLLFELLAGYSPFLSHSQDKMFMNIKKKSITWPDGFDSKARDLIESILVEDSKRPPIEIILSHPFFEENKSDLPDLPIKRMSKKEYLRSLMLKEYKSKRQADNKDETLDLVVVSHYKEIIRKLEVGFKAKMAEKDNEIREKEFELSQTLENHQSEISVLKAELKGQDKEIRRNIRLKEQIETFKEEVESLKQALKIKEEREKEREVQFSSLQNQNNSMLTELGAVRKELIESNYSVECLRAEVERVQNSKSEDLKDYANKLERIQALFVEESAEEGECSCSRKLISVLREETEDKVEKMVSSIADLGARMEEVRQELSIEKVDREKSLEQKQQCIKQWIDVIEQQLKVEYSTVNALKESPDRNLDWYKGKVSELLEVKKKNLQLMAKMKSLKGDLEYFKEKENMLESNCFSLRSNVKIKNEKIKKMEVEKTKLENQISDLKLFFFKKFPDNLEDFQSYFKRR